MGRASQEFDRQLFTLKLSELSRQMQIKSVASDRKAGAEARKTGGSHLMKIVDGQLALLREWLEWVDQICREVWQIQGRALMPEFVRNVLLPEALTVIEARKGSIISDVSLMALRTHAEDPHAAQHHLTMEVNALKSKVSTQYEIEALTFGHKTAKPPIPAFTFRSRDPNPTRVPPNPPMYFPTDLWPQTNVILLEAQREFPQQTQTLELCSHVTAKMTPVFCEAVRGTKIKASSVLQEGCGGMEDLLHALLVYNDDDPHSGFSSLSDQAYRLGLKVRQSDEWLKLAKAITEAEEQRTHPALQNKQQTLSAALEKQTESPRVQNSANSTQDVESNSTNVAPSNAQGVFIDRAIASRKRMESSMSGEVLEANPLVLDAQKSRSLLGIELARLEHLRRGVWKKFFDEASIPRVVEAEWQSVLSLRKMPDSNVDLGLTFALTKEYQKAIARASAQLADLLATAAGSRINQAHLREVIWRECLDFACQLGQWDAFTTWVKKVVQVGWRPVDADGQDSLAPDRECEKRGEERRKFFEGRIGMHSREWLSAIDEAIELRLTVSAHTVNASGEIGEQTKAKATESKSARINPEVAKRVALVKANLGIPAEEMCQFFDRENVPLPAKWLASGFRTWSEAYKDFNYRSRIDTLISKGRTR